MSQLMVVMPDGLCVHVQKLCAGCPHVSTLPVHAPPAPSSPASPRPAAPVLQIIEQYRGEQLAYIAAFTIEAQLVYGDRPKDVTLRWGGGAGAVQRRSSCLQRTCSGAGLGACAAGAPAPWQHLAAATACLLACSTMMQQAQACSSCCWGVCWCVHVHATSFHPARKA